MPGAEKRGLLESIAGLGVHSKVEVKSGVLSACCASAMFAKLKIDDVTEATEGSGAVTGASNLS